MKLWELGGEAAHTLQLSAVALASVEAEAVYESWA
jgi:hypothetical protein